MIPHLTWLDREILASRDLVRRAELQAERAAYLARCGDAVGAGRVIQQLRTHFGDGREPRVSVATMWAEGVLLYFGKLSDQARDRWLRAHALARAMQLEYLQPLCAAWLAQAESQALRPDAMARLLQEVADTTRPEWPAVNVRAGLVAADALLLAGRADAAQRAYERAREACLRAGDRVSLGALLYNRAATLIAVARAEEALSGQPCDTRRGELLVLHARSSLAYQRATGVTALDHLGLLWSGRALALAGRHDEAVAELRPLRRTVADLEARRNRSAVSADLARSLAALGPSGELFDVLQTLSVDEAAALDPDDALSYLYAAAQALERAGEAGRAAPFGARLPAARERHRQQLAELQAVADTLAGLRCIAAAS